MAPFKHTGHPPAALGQVGPGHSPEPRLLRTFEFYGLFRPSSHSKHVSSLRTVVPLLHDAEFMTEPGVHPQVLLESLWQRRPLRGQEIHRVSVTSGTKWQRERVGWAARAPLLVGGRGRFLRTLSLSQDLTRESGDGRERTARPRGRL